MHWSPGRTGVTVLALLAACGGEPEVVYVHSDGFREELFVMSEKGDSVRVQVGERLLLSAARRSGPWKAVPRDSLDEAACWLEAPPVELEAEVAANLRWTAEPAAGASFNVEPRADGGRDVRFDRPGFYVLVAESASWCREPFQGAPIYVQVVDG